MGRKLRDEVVSQRRNWHSAIGAAKPMATLRQCVTRATRPLRVHAEPPRTR
jgi:hypothetical protein